MWFDSSEPLRTTVQEYSARGQCGSPLSNLSKLARAEGSDAVREAAVAASRARAMGYEGLRSEQLQIVQSFVTGHDVFGVLPTGSACYRVQSGSTLPNPLCTSFQRHPRRPHGTTYTCEGVTCAHRTSSNLHTSHLHMCRWSTKVVAILEAKQRITPHCIAQGIGYYSAFEIGDPRPLVLIMTACELKIVIGYYSAFEIFLVNAVDLDSFPLWQGIPTAEGHSLSTQPHAGAVAIDVLKLLLSLLDEGSQFRAFTCDATQASIPEDGQVRKTTLGEWRTVLY